MDTAPTMSLETIVPLTPKVEISYFDPFHVFNGLRSQIEERLPLTNLRWKTNEGTLKTITKLNLDFIESVGEESENDLVSKPFINCVIVSCETVEEYRTKIRPLIKNWLPLQKDSCSSDIAILHSNKEILDSNLFKSVSLIEKISKDFPDLKTLETKTVYKSNDDKEAFWKGLFQKLKQILLEVFERRIDTYLLQLKDETDIVKSILIHENLLKLYLSFHLTEEAHREIISLHDLLSNNGNVSKTPGVLRSPFFQYEKFSVNAISSLIAQEELTSFVVEKSILQAHIELFMISSGSHEAEERLETAFHNCMWNLRALHKDNPFWFEFKYNLYDEFINLCYFEDIQSDNWKLLICDMKNEQRECWVHLACSAMGYSVPWKSFSSNGNFEVSDSMKQTFESVDTFHHEFQRRSRQVLQQYSEFSSKRQRVMDWISIEIALLQFDQEKPMDSLSTLLFLQSSYDFYMQSNWSTIASWLLRHFVQCIAHHSDIKEIDIDGDLVPRSIVLSNSYLNLVTSDSKESAKWWNKFLTCNAGSNDDLVYPLDKLFTTVVRRQVFPIGPNRYGIEVVFGKKFPIKDFDISSVVLVIKNYADEFLSFSVDNVTLSADSTTLILSSNTIIWCVFELVELELIIGNTVFKKQFASLEGEDSLIVEKCYARNASEIQVANLIDRIGAESFFKLTFHNFDDIEDFTMLLTVPPNSDVRFENGTKDVTIKSQDSNKVLFRTTSDYEIELTTELTFTRNKTLYSDKGTTTIKSVVPLEMEITDYFVDEIVTLECCLQPATDETIIIFSVDLKNSDHEKYSVTTSTAETVPVLLGQTLKVPFHTFFQVSKKAGLFSSNEVFHIAAKYLTLRDFLELTFEYLIPQKDNTALDYNVWKNNIARRIDIDLKELEKARRLFARTSDSNILQSLSQIKNSSFRMEVLHFLKRIETGVSIDDFFAFNNIQRLHELTLDVKLSTMEFQYSVYFTNLGTSGTLKSGLPSSFLVTVKTLSKDWDVDCSAGTSVMRISNNSEWIVGGKRRFEIVSEEATFEVNLIPLRRGYLNYPFIEVTDDKGELLAQVEYLNLNDKVLVL